MNKQEIVAEIGKPILRPLGILQAVFLLAFFGSPFIWVWFSFTLAWKIALTAIIGAIIVAILYKLIKGILNEEVGEMLRKPKPFTKSNFQIKLEEMAKKKGVDLNNTL